MAYRAPATESTDDEAAESGSAACHAERNTISTSGPCTFCLARCLQSAEQPACLSVATQKPLSADKLLCKRCTVCFLT